MPILVAQASPREALSHAEKPLLTYGWTSKLAEAAPRIVTGEPRLGPQQASGARDLPREGRRSMHAARQARGRRDGEVRTHSMGRTVGAAKEGRQAGPRERRERDRGSRRRFSRPDRLGRDLDGERQGPSDPALAPPGHPEAHDLEGERRARLAPADLEGAPRRGDEALRAARGARVRLRMIRAMASWAWLAPKVRALAMEQDPDSFR